MFFFITMSTITSYSMAAPFYYTLYRVRLFLFFYLHFARTSPELLILSKFIPVHMHLTAIRNYKSSSLMLLLSINLCHQTRPPAEVIFSLSNRSVNLWPGCYWIPTLSSKSSLSAPLEITSYRIQALNCYQKLECSPLVQWRYFGSFSIRSVNS